MALCSTMLRLGAAALALQSVCADTDGATTRLLRGSSHPTGASPDVNLTLKFALAYRNLVLDNMTSKRDVSLPGGNGSTPWCLLLPTSPPDSCLDERSRCHVEAGPDGCSLSSLHGVTCTHRIYPGGKTRCMTSEDPDYFFQVIKGHAHKLLLYFEGGGACTSQRDVDLNFCKLTPKVASLDGVLSRNSSNPFWDYSVIVVTYCSGDIFVASLAQPWKDSNSQTVQQRGYDNTRAALDWAAANFPQLSDLVIAGSSAGAMGIQWWSTHILGT
mmetsp:Transcript_98545/g.248781  ORF Transcript_98545/g.248781 Transcript_98545/m.248781 type:complete len:272 (+) Transcript_98545:35-850(+)